MGTTTEVATQAPVDSDIGIKPDDLSQRSRRQQEFIPPDKLAQYVFHVIGVGAIGRQVALQLAAIGVSDLILWDHDKVEAINLGPQGYWEADIGEYKALSTADLCRKFCSTMQVHEQATKFDNILFSNLLDAADDNRPHIIFCCVDNMDTRTDIFDNVIGWDAVAMFLDARMLGETLYVYNVFDSSSRDNYRKSLFPASEATQGRCTARSTIYTSNIAAGLMVCSFSKWLRGIKPEFSINMALTSMELEVSR